jgi:pyruvate dehydrogenase E2 component (dihydrolipoamide acetyltransferase)
VLLHGVATSRLVWRRVIGPLARGRHVIAVDVPGFGESEPAGPGFELDEVADRLIGGLEPDRFDLVGHSLGGAVAVATAARHPDAVRGLVLVAPAGLEPRATHIAAALGAAAERAVYARRAFGYQLAARSRGRQAMFGATVADAGRLHPEDARLLLDASIGARRVAAGVRRALEADLRDDLAAAPMPVGVIWGAADRVVPYAGLEALRRLRPDAAVETIPATGHIPQIERPAEFVAALERILARLGAP